MKLGSSQHGVVIQFAGWVPYPMWHRGTLSRSKDRRPRSC